MSECGTWSHAVMSSLGVRARGGVGRAPAFSVARCQIWTRVSHPRCPSTEDFGNRTVTFRIDHTPLHRIAVQFEWAEPFGELQKNQRMSHFGGHVSFRRKKKSVPFNAARGLQSSDGSRQGPPWPRMGPYVNRTLIRDSRVIRQGLSGPVGPYRVPTDFRRDPDLARQDPTWLDGSLDCPVSVHD